VNLNVQSFQSAAQDVALDEVDETDYTALSRPKRTIGFASRFASCLFTLFRNPECRNVGRRRSLSTQTQSRAASDQQQQLYNQWLQWQLVEWARNNGSEGNYSTPFPIFPPSQTTPTPDEPVTNANPIQQFVDWKLNLIPNTLRRLFPNIFGGRRTSFNNNIQSRNQGTFNMRLYGTGNNDPNNLVNAG